MQYIPELIVVNNADKTRPYFVVQYINCHRQVQLSTSEHHITINVSRCCVNETKFPPSHILITIIGTLSNAIYFQPYFIWYENHSVYDTIRNNSIG